VIKLR